MHAALHTLCLAASTLSPDRLWCTLWAVQACGLFMFPTKALAQDQLRVLRQLMADAFGADAPCVEVRPGVLQ
jgi:ATP-dependent helicase YprA (DUF1998 family)